MADMMTHAEVLALKRKVIARGESAQAKKTGRHPVYGPRRWRDMVAGDFPTPPDPDPPRSPADDGRPDTLASPIGGDRRATPFGPRRWADTLTDKED